MDANVRLIVLREGESANNFLTEILLSERKTRENKNFPVFFILYKKRALVSGLSFAKPSVFFHCSSESIIVVAWTYSYNFQWDVWHATWPQPHSGSTQHDGSMDSRACLSQGITGSLMLFVATPSAP